MPKNDDVSIGLNYPIRRSEDGYFDKTYTSIDEVKVNIINALATRKGERIMNPDFGSDLHRIIYEQTTVDLEEAVEEEIRNVVETWVPQATLNEISIERNSEKKALFTDIEFTTPFLPNNKKENLELWFSFD